MLTYACKNLGDEYIKKVNEMLIGEEKEKSPVFSCNPYANISPQWGSTNPCYPPRC